MSRPLYISRPLLPDLSKLRKLQEEIWYSGIVTNGGNFHNKLENALEKYLDVPVAMLFNNGTIALLVALKIFDFPQNSEVITTPLTFAATAHAISWNGLTPIFADICPETLTIDPEAVERAITQKTVAILAVHVYGTICNVDALQRIAEKYSLKLIYDAAHAFGATINNRSIGLFGDASVFSFHATKLFNTIEGGLIATPNEEYKEKIYLLRNFGIKDEESVVSIGINGKMNEIQSAIGILNLEIFEDERNKRNLLRKKYCEHLKNIPGIRLPLEQKNVLNSEQYFPLVISPTLYGRNRDAVYEALKRNEIFSRKYFHPICTDFLPYKEHQIFSAREIPYVEEIKQNVLCLPFHSGVEDEDIEDICKIIRYG